MKNFKRILALVIAIVMVVGTFASLSAAGSKWYSEAVTFIEENGIAVIGANADKKITRNDFVLWVAKIESHQLSDTAWNEQIANTVFTDVTDAHHKAAIAYSARRNFIIGNGDGTFSPDKATTFAEACAVIVRVMGYENKVYDTSADAWAFNYMQVANTYCHAIDDVFMKETDTYNPDYELTQGEAAYLLATIMNFNKQPTDSDYSETSDGINLGEWFDVNGGSTGVVGKSYYVQSINRVCNGESMSTLLALGGQKGLLYTNELDTAKDVVLLPTDGTAPLVIDGASFLKMLRISLGLNPERDIANEEPEINVFSYLDVGSIVNIVIDKSATSTNAYLDNDNDGTYTEADQKITVSSLSASSNSVIVDTYLQATSAKEGEDYGDGSNGASEKTNLIISAADLSKYVGWTIREIGTTENTCPVLPASYSAELATSWTNVVKDASGVVTSAVLNFKGQTYTVNGSSDEIAIYSGDDLTTVLTPNEAVNAIINIAQGEALVVFNDIDGDGRYDSAIVKESDPFLYVGVPNVAGSTTATYDYYSSLSNGTVIGNARMKGNALGTVIYNKSVEFAAGGTTGVADYRTDGYLLKDSATGKMQLILRASNKHFFIDGATDTYGNASPHFYKVVDLATFGVGVIEEVDAFALDNYYVAKIVQTDGTSKTVYIPITPAEKTTLPVTVDGVTADYTFDSSNWCTFLTTMRDSVVASGIVSGVEDPGYKAATAAWMAGKYVQFAVDADSKVIVMLGTDSSVNVSGFVTGVTKTDTGDNTFNVSIARSGSGNVSDTAYYLTAALDATSNEYRITTEYTLGGNSSATPTIGKLHLLNTSGIWYFMNGTNIAAGNAWAYYGYNQGRRMLVAESGNAPHATTVGLLNEAINSEIYNATENRANGKVSAWTVDADGIVHDETGKAVAYQYVTIGRTGVAGISTYEVRANASSMFDWKNYEVYNAIFSGKLADPNGMEDGRVNPGEDLIYVTVMQDAATKYLKYGDQVNWPATSYGAYSSSSYYNVKEAGSSQDSLMRLWASKITINSKPAESWVNVEGRYNISLTEVEGSRVYAEDKSSYTADYKGTVGFGPYYERTYNTTKKAYEYVLKFTRVVEYTGVTGSATAVIDKTKTLMTPVYVGESGTVSTQLKATTDADFAKYTIANGFYIDDVTNLVYQLIDKAEIVYKTDDKGNIVYSDVKYDWDNGTVAVEYTSGTEVLFSTYKVGKYATFTYAAADKDTTEGWYPGLSTVTLDGKSYTATSSLPVIIVTPSGDGFSITTTTLANVSTDGLFVTDWNAVEEYGKLSAIAIIGEKAAAYTDGGGTVTPDPTDEGTLVYLDSNAKAIVRAAAYGKSWLVVSDRSAYALPTGEEIGVIYREYSTYEEATKAASIDLSVYGGHWYRIDENGKILSDVTSVVYATLTGNFVDPAEYTVNTGYTVDDGNFGAKAITVYEKDGVAFYKNSDGVYKFITVAAAQTDVVYYEVSEGKYKVVTVTEIADAAEGAANATLEDGVDFDVKTIDATKATSTTYKVENAEGEIEDVTVYTYEYPYNSVVTEGETIDYVLTKLSTSATSTVYKTTNLDTNINVILIGDVYYEADSNYRRIELSSTLSLIKQGTITKTDAAGNTYATIDGVKNVNVTNYDFAFFYRNADASVLYKAGDSTSVTIATRKIYNNQIKTQQEAYDKAVAAYEEALAKGYLSEERIAYYKAEVDKTEAALAEAKNSLLDKYFNGRFWGVPNSPFYLYVQRDQGSFQQPTSALTFNYVKVGDTYCVFSDEFILG